jgi:hypothetical protein
VAILKTDQKTGMVVGRIAKFDHAARRYVYLGGDAQFGQRRFVAELKGKGK